MFCTSKLTFNLTVMKLGYWRTASTYSGEHMTIERRSNWLYYVSRHKYSYHKRLHNYFSNARFKQCADVYSNKIKGNNSHLASSSQLRLALSVGDKYFTTTNRSLYMSNMNNKIKTIWIDSDSWPERDAFGNEIISISCAIHLQCYRLIPAGNPWC